MDTDKETQLYEHSKYSEIIHGLLKQEFQKDVILSHLHLLKQGDGNTVFLAVSKEGFRFLIDITGRKIQDDAILFWVENIDYAGKLLDLYYERDIVIITFARGEKYNNEYLAYMYSYGNRYPSIRFIPNERYPAYVQRLNAQYRKHEIKLSPELMAVIGL